MDITNSSKTNFERTLAENDVVQTVKSSVSMAVLFIEASFFNPNQLVFLHLIACGQKGLLPVINREPIKSWLLNFA